MTERTDHELLTEFACAGTESAFAALVKRHVNLVYSVALRFAGDPHLAEEITQTVFIVLARKAGSLTAKTIIPGWLYHATRLTAARSLRNIRRQQQREQLVCMESALNQPDTGAAWKQIAPALDEAINTLRTADRDAVLLRYFENKPLAEVGQALGVSEDAARVRINRALEKLRKFFSRRGTALSTAVIAGAVSTYSVHAAPPGLATTITAAALSGTTATTTAFIATTKTIAMTTLQKTLITITLATTVGVGIYEAKEAAKVRAEVQTLQHQQTPLAEQNRLLQRERDDATNRLAGLLVENARLKSNLNQNELLKLRGEVAQLKMAQNDPANKTKKALLDKVNWLKQQLETNPNAKIPEFQFLTDQDWLIAANGKLDSETDYRKAFASLRNAAENKFGSLVENALQKYYQANGTTFPPDFTQLQPYFESPVDDSVLQRWQFTSAQTVPNVDVGDPIITQKAAVDDLFDSRIVIGPRAYGSSDFLASEIKTTLDPVYQAFMAANNGQEPTSQAQLQPYATTPEQKALLQKVMERAALDSGQ